MAGSEDLDADCCVCTLLLLGRTFEAVTGTLGNDVGVDLVVGNNDLLPPIIFLIGAEMAAIGGADRIDVSDGDERTTDDDDGDGGGGGNDLTAVI